MVEKTDHTDRIDQSGLLTLLSGMILMLVLGSVHAFSVFLEPLETGFNAPRSDVSLTYSLALVCLTISVLFGDRVFKHLKPASLIILVCTLAAVGCLISALASTLQTVWLGYSLMFGAANGLGYALALQSSAQANPHWKGIAMGVITASYALGAVLSPLFFKLLLDHHGFSGAMTGLAVILFLIAPVTCALMIKGKTQLRVDQPLQEEKASINPSTIFILWLGYGSAVLAGLMVIGHATGIARAGGMGDGIILAAPIIVSALNMMGSLLGGWLTDRLSTKTALMLFATLTTLSLLILIFGTGHLAILTGLAIIGFSYGATIAAYPVAISSLFGPVAGVRIYGRVFTAWGFAGLAGPWLAGYLYERSGDYHLALMIACFAGMISFTIIYLSASLKK